MNPKTQLILALIMSTFCVTLPENSNAQLTITPPPGSGVTSTKNATVGSGAPIQPAQAFVDNIALFVGSADLALSNKGITFVSPSLLQTYMGEVQYAGGIGTFTANLSGNAIANTSDILAAMASLAIAESYPQGATLNFDGGTNAAPAMTGLVAYGTTGFSPTGMTNGKQAYYDTVRGRTLEWSGTQWELNDPNGDGMLATSTENVATPDLVVTWIDVIGNGQPGVTPGNVALAALRGIPWTVTTN